MSHTLILGITGSGKTTLAKKLAKQYKRRGVGVLVLTPFLHDDWAADFICDVPEKFLSVVLGNINCAVFVDESGEMVGRYSVEMDALATRTRQYGHNVHFISQRAQQISLTVRTMCENIFLFRQSLTDAKILANEYVADGLLAACDLPKGQCLSKIGIDGKIKLLKVF